MHNLYSFAIIKEKIIETFRILKTLLKSNKLETPTWLVELEDLLNQFSRNSDDIHIRMIYETHYPQQMSYLRKKIERENLSNFYTISEDLHFYIDLLSYKSFI